MKNKILVLIFCMIFLSGTVIAADYRFQNKTGADLLVIHDSGNLTVAGNVSASTGFFSSLGILVSRITSLFVIDIDSSGNLFVTGNGTIGKNFTVDTNTLFVDSVLNRVGIGTSSPDRTLTVDSSGIVAAEFLGVGSTGAIDIGRQQSSAISFARFRSSTTSGWSIGTDGSNSEQFRIARRFDATLDNPQLVIDISGNVGINTTTPQNLLNVLGDANITGLIYGNGSQLTDISQSSIPDVYLLNTGDTATGNYTFDTNTFFIDSSSNRVGIGTSSPTEILHIKESTSAKILIETTSASDASITFSTADQGWAIGVDGSVANDPFRINTGSSPGSSDMFLIDSSGNVGIGTTSPSEQLELGNGGKLQLNDASGARTLTFEQRNGGNSLIQSSIGGIGFGTSGATDEFFIKSGGNIGIGDTSPGAKLDITGNETHVSGDLAGTDGILRLYNEWESDVAGKGATITFEDNYNASGSFFRTTRAAIKGGTQTTGNTANGFLAFYTDSSSANTMQERVRIDKDGNVGIGTTSPDTILHILTTSATGIMLERTGAGGNIWHSFITNKNYVIKDITNNKIPITIESNASDNMLYLDSSGNVGIGTASPGEKLEIKGNLRLRNDAADSEFEIKDANILHGMTAIVESDTHTRIKNAQGSLGGTEVLGISDSNSDTSSIDGVLTLYGVHGWTDPTNTDTAVLIKGAKKNGTGATNLGDDETVFKVTNFDTDLLSVLGNGFVGIGTTTPQNTLNVLGDINFTGLIYGNGSQLTDISQASIPDVYLLNTGDTATGNYTFDTDTFFIDSSSGRVGIGTASPDRLLDINGTSRFRDDLSLDQPVNINFANGQSIDDNGGGGLRIVVPTFSLNLKAGTDSSAVIDFSTNNLARMTIKQDGKVGIGTTTPSRIFHVEGNTLLNGTVEIGWGNSNKRGQLSFSGGDFIIDGAVANQVLKLGKSSGTVFSNMEFNLNNNTDGDFSFIVNGSEKVTIKTNTGRVGIGTTSPGKTLDVSGDIKASGRVIVNTIRDTVGENTWLSVTGTTPNYIINVGNAGTRDLNFNTKTSGGSFIFNDGNVGIGTTGPNATLEVINGTTQGGFMVSSSSSGAGDLFIVDENGNVGIGTSSPERSLHILGGGIKPFIITTSDYVLNSIGSKISLEFGASTGNTYGKIQTTDAGGSSASNLVLQSDSGNVGIGTTSPDKLLHVFKNNTIPTLKIGDSGPGIETLGAAELIFSADTLAEGGNSFRIRFNKTTGVDKLGFIDGGNNEILSLLNGGRVGINTTTPQNTLNIIGDLNVTGTIFGAGGANLTGDFVPYTGATKNVDLGANNFTVDTNTFFVDSSSGRVGIGTTTPQAKLDVKDGVIYISDTNVAHGVTNLLPTNVALAIKKNNNDGGFDALGISEDGTTAGMLLRGIIGANSASLPAVRIVTAVKSGVGQGSVGATSLAFDIVDQPQTTSFLSILGSGNVGIGTSTPQNTLNVIGDANITGNITSGQFIIAPSGLVPALTGAPDAKIFSPSAQHGSESTWGIRYNEGTPDYIEFWDGSAVTSRIQLDDGSAHFALQSGSSVGIGTDSPDALLEIEKTGAAGDVEIHLDAGRSADLVIDRGSTSGRYNIFFKTADVEKWKIGNNAAGDEDLDFTSPGGALFTIEQTGNVGINTTTPQNTLNVIGDLNVTGTIFGAGGANLTGDFVPYTGATKNVDLGANNFTVDTDTFFIDSSSNRVGIGTISPVNELGVKLEVNGSIIINPSTGHGDLILSNAGIVGNEDNYIRWRNSTGNQIWILGTPGDSGDLHVKNKDGDIQFTLRKGGKANFGQDTIPDAVLEISNDINELDVLMVSSNASQDGDLFIVKGSGNVGIGTTSPVEHLSIEGSGEQILSIYSTDTGVVNTQKTFIKMYGENTASAKREQVRLSSAPGSSASSAGQFIISTSDVDLSLKERMRIDEDGKVGIGTTSPDNLFEVAFSDSTIVNETNIQSDSIKGLYISNELNAAGTNQGSVLMFDNVAGRSRAVIAARHQGTNLDTSVLIFYTHSSTEDIQQRMIIDQNGRVGIGTTSPGTPLHIVDGTDSGLRVESTDGFSSVEVKDTTDSAYFGTVSSRAFMGLTFGLSANNLNIDTSGKVGIGTTTPQNLLNVLGDINFTGLIYGNGSQLTDISQASIPDVYLLNTGDTATGNYTFDTDTFFIDSSSDRIGIGTSSPQAKVHIQDTSNSVTLSLRGSGSNNAVLQFTTAAETNYIGVDDAVAGLTLGGTIDGVGSADPTMIVKSNNGNVGIGTTSPEEKLDVTGNIILNHSFFLKSERNDGNNLNLIGVESGTQNIIIGESTSTPSEVIIYTPIDAGQGFNVVQSDGATTAFWVENDGNVGIGTKSPNAELEISAGTPKILLTQSSGDPIIETASGGNLRFFIGGSETVRFQTTGNVGIGTTSPGAKLDIQGGTTADIFDALELSNPKDGSNQSSRITFVLARTGNEMRDAAYIEAKKEQTWTDGFTHSASLLFYTKKGDGATNTISERMRIDSSGQVGIGTTSPGSILSLSQLGGPELNFDEPNTSIADNLFPLGNITFSGSDGSINASGIYTSIESYVIDTNNLLQGSQDEGGRIDFNIWRHDVSTQSRIKYTALTIDNFANVGIGTSSPANILHVEKDGTYTSASTTQTGAQQIIKAASNNMRLYLGIDNVSKFAYIQASEPGIDNRHLILQPNGGNGNVGIGTTSPADVLTVVGTLNATNIQLASNCADGQILKWSGGVGTCGTDDSGSFNSFFIDTDETTSTEITDGETILFSDSTGMTVTRSGNTITFLTTLGTSISGGEVDADTLDFVDFADDLDLDATTNIDFGSGSNSFILDLETGTGDFIIQDAGTMFAQFYDSGDIQLGNNNELYVDTSAGNVGIGTASPTDKLEVSGTPASPTSGTAGTAKIGFNPSSFTLGSGPRVINLFPTDIVDGHGIGLSSGRTEYYTNSVHGWFVRPNRANISDVYTSTEIMTLDSSGNLQIDGDLKLTNLLDNDASNFFDGGCSADQHVTSISSTGAITCGADTGHTASMSFTLAGTSGSSQTITQGNTLLIEAGAAITTTGAATDKVTVAVTANSIGDTQLAFNTGQALTTSSSPTFVDLTLSGGDLSMTPDGPSAQIADTFSANTFKNYINFAAGSGSNDPGAILHETSGTETNEGVLHLMPSDDNTGTDYVSIHGTNDPDVLRLFTDGSITGITSIDSFFSGGASASQTVTGITDLGVLSTTAIAITGSQVSDDGTFVLVAGDTMTGSLTVNGVVLTDELRDRTGQQLVLNAGESEGQATGQTAEYIYLNAEQGIQVVSSPDNWASGWAGRDTTLISGTAITVDGNTVHHAGNDPLDTISEWDALCTDCVGNDDLAANSVDLTSDALSTAYAGNGLGGGGTAALFVNAGADIDITGDAVAIEPTLDTVNSILSLQQIRYETGDRFILQFFNDADSGIRQDDTNNQFDWYLNNVEKGSFDFDTGDMQMDGDLTVSGGDTTIGSTSSTSNSNLNVYAGDTVIATIQARGSSQGSGMVYVGQSASHGGGIAYDGDGSPAMVGSTDHISIFRRSSSADTAVLEWLHNSNRAEFRGDIDMNNNSIIGVWKLTLNTGGEIDPPYRIGNTVYTTYVPFMIGVKEETSGSAQLVDGKYVINFNSLERGSDLWLFYEVTDFGDNWEKLQIILTPGFDGMVWYNKNPLTNTLTIYGTGDGEVSYRLTANGFTWGDRTNVATDLNVNDYKDMDRRKEKAKGL